jgi:hypothetical protein
MATSKNAARSLRLKLMLPHLLKNPTKVYHNVKQKYTAHVLSYYQKDLRHTVGGEQKKETGK